MSQYLIVPLLVEAENEIVEAIKLERMTTMAKDADIVRCENSEKTLTCYVCALLVQGGGIAQKRINVNRNLWKLTQTKLLTET